MEYVIGVDIGGTFTDCVALDSEGTVKVGKALSTPEDFSNGALNAVADAAKNLGLRDEAELLAATKMFFHACTVADNTLITRSGPKTGLITTKGFGDTILLMRGRTTEGLTETEAFRASTQSKPEPIIPQPYIEELSERIDYKGSVLIRLKSGGGGTGGRSSHCQGRRIHRHFAALVVSQRRPRAIGRRHHKEEVPCYPCEPVLRGRSFPASTNERPQSLSTRILFPISRST